MRTDTRPTRTPRERAKYFTDKANVEDLAADDCAAQHDRRGEKWHRTNAESFRTQAEFIINNTKGGLS